MILRLPMALAWIIWTLTKMRAYLRTLNCNLTVEVYSLKKADQACAFEERLKSYGAVSRRKRLSWRYRWPDELRDAVLARLLALNAERYEEEQSQGLHGGGYKQKGNGAGKRRSRPAKAVMEPADTEQIGLGL